MNGINNDGIYTILKAINVRGANRTHKSVRVDILGSMMVQCDFTITEAMKLADIELEDQSSLSELSMEGKRLTELPYTLVKIGKATDVKQVIKW